MQVEPLIFQCVRVIKQMESAMGKRWFANCAIYYQETTYERSRNRCIQRKEHGCRRPPLWRSDSKTLHGTPHRQRTQEAGTHPGMIAFQYHFAIFTFQSASRRLACARGIITIIDLLFLDIYTVF
jgi:hypothetical protein